MMDREAPQVRSLLNAFLFILMAILLILSSSVRAQEGAPLALPGGSTEGAALAAPAKPTPYSPFNGDVSNNLKPALRWVASSGATKYNVTLTETGSNTETTGLVDAADCTSVCAYKFADKLVDGLTYSWQVEAVNSAGKTSSDLFTITIDFPGVPTLLTPLHNDKVHSGAIEFSWTRIAKASEYILKIEDTDDDSIVVKRTIDAAICSGVCVYTLKSSDQTSIHNGHDYRWSVMAKHKKGTSLSGNYTFKARFN